MPLTVLTRSKVYTAEDRAEIAMEVVDRPKPRRQP
jgi:hypothetical protein